MNTGSYYKLKHFIPWTRRNIYRLLVLATVPTVVFALFGIHWIAIPWPIIALVGVGASFIAGFRNTQTYNRLWEARKIWGAIINDSRTWGIMTRDFITEKQEGKDGPYLAEIHQRIIYRHFAWLTALRHQLRKPQSWENQSKPYFKEYLTYYKVPEWEIDIRDDLKPFLSQEDLEHILERKNRATQLLALQSEDLKRLKKKGLIEEFPYVNLGNQLKDFYNHQGRCERIKNFPYPRQFTSISLYFIWMLVILVPFGLLEPLSSLGEYGIWLTIPFSVIIGWVFTSLEQVGESTENPFEGGANDIPMAQISRAIEIDLREMLGETELPDPIVATNEILL
ncbi:bestrophin family protein [Algoriphagus resistens]|uniref:bestrophin family protein n=1 Tax=Algoriphagus resistens TaxID=1750590 RepID=UPI00071688DE|nr:bestrophin family ion channel [Algoriphagus resistens]